MRKLLQTVKKCLQKPRISTKPPIDYGTDPKQINMKILATISIGPQNMTQTWEFSKGSDSTSPRLEIMRLKDGGCVVMPLEHDRVQSVQNADVAEKVYTGTLDIAQAIIVPAPPPVK
jgi:hypothetical protein